MLVVSGRLQSQLPSGEASVAAAPVTPYILEYGSECPLTYGLLPLYVGAGRKEPGALAGDVITGWAIGGMSGWYTHSREQPILIELVPYGVAVGIRKQF